MSLAVRDDPFADGFSPFESVSLAKTQINTLIFSRLFRRTASGIEPDLAEAWDVSGDGREWVIQIRQDARFHDGRPVTAYDVLYSVEAFLSRGVPPHPVIESMFLIDDFTIGGRFRTEFRRLPSQLVHDQAIIVQLGMLEEEVSLGKLVGSGPFVPIEYDRGGHLLMKRNPDYYETGRPYVDRIRILFVHDRATMLADFGSGQLDFLDVAYTHGLPRLTQKELETIPPDDSNIVSVPPQSAFVVWFDTQSAPFDDVRIRRAIWLAIDQPLVNEVVWEGQGELPYVWAGQPNELWHKYDPDSSRELLKEAGYPDGFDTVLVIPDRDWVILGEIIANMLGQVGINVNLVILEPRDFAEAAVHAYEGIVIAPLQRFGGDIDSFLHAHFAEGGSHNYGRLSSQLIEEVLSEWGHGDEIDQDGRQKLLRVLQEHIVENALLVPLPAAPAIYVRNGRVQGPISATDLGTMMKQVWIEEAAAVRPATPIPTPAAPPASIKGTVLYNGQPLPEATDATPSFSVFIRDVYDHAEVPLYDNSTGQYEILGLTPGEYTIIVLVDSAEPFNGEHGFALDFRGSASVEVPKGPAPVELDLPVTHNIHLTSPVDNQRTFGQTSDPKDTYSARPLSFEWDAIPEAVSYDVYLQLFKEPYTHLEPIREEHGVLDTSFAIDLPTNGYDEFYVFRLDAKNANDEPVGRLTAPYSNGHGWDYRFRIVEPIMDGNPDPAYSQWKRFVKPGVVEDYIAYVPRISDFGDFDSYVDDGSFLIIQGGGFENSVVGFRTWLYHDGSASYEVGISGDDGVALYCNGAFIVGRVNAEGSASYGIMELNSGWNKIEALVYSGPTHIELRLKPVLSTIGVVDANAYAYAPAPASGATIAATHEFPTEPLRGDRVFLNSGTLNGQQITSSNPFLSVTPGQAISGTVNLMVANDHGGHAVFPVEATPTWGDHQSGYWDVPISVPSYGTARRDVTIDLTAPSTPGVYAIIFAAQAEFSGGYITSATHWPSGSPRWNNGDDIAGWSASQIDFAIANGYLRAHQHGSGVDFAHFGAAAVKIIVP